MPRAVPLLVSFAAYGLAEVVRELVSAIERGVRIDLVLERSVEQVGTLRTETGGATFAALAGHAHVWHWPATNLSGGRATLQAKVAVADGASALLSNRPWSRSPYPATLRIVRAAHTGAATAMARQRTPRPGSTTPQRAECAASNPRR